MRLREFLKTFIEMEVTREVMKIEGEKVIDDSGWYQILPVLCLRDFGEAVV